MQCARQAIESETVLSVSKILLGFQHECRWLALELELFPTAVANDLTHLVARANGKPQREILGVQFGNTYAAVREPLRREPTLKN